MTNYHMKFGNLNPKDAVYSSGASIKYVRAEGGGGLKILLISAYNSTDRLREMHTRGREGVKNPENFAYVLNGCSLGPSC